jgi:hypothetical protein
LLLFGVHAGFAQLERSSDGPEIGAFLDLGWLRGRSLRLQGEVAFQRATLTEYLALEDTTFHGDYFDLSLGLSAAWFLSPDGQVSPYALAGVAVHALSSTFGTSELDQRYNANRFGSHLGAGVRFRIGSSRQAVFAEARRVIADEVNRTVVRIGGPAPDGRPLSPPYRKSLGRQTTGGNVGATQDQSAVEDQEEGPVGCAT